MEMKLEKKEKQGTEEQCKTERLAEAEKSCKAERHTEAEKKCTAERHTETEKKCTAERHTETEKSCTAERHTEAEKNRSPEKKYLQEASVGMALMDALPVLCFCGTIALLTTIWKSPLFLAGGILCIAAGTGKVLWKLLLAVSGKNIRGLYTQFRYLMSGGFLLMLLSLAAGWKSVRADLIWKNLTWFPGNICFLTGSLCMALMIFLAARMDASEKKTNWIEQSVNLVAQLAFLLGVLLVWYGNDTYAADDKALKALQDTAAVSVREIAEGYWFDGEGTERAMIFYPGAKVDHEAYAPLMMRLAEEGTDCFLLEMPYHMAIFGKDKADQLLEKYAYQHWYMAGHSLGGAMAASYASEQIDRLDGLVLLAAYPTKTLDREGFRVLSLYGSEDGVLQMEKLEAGGQYMPKDAVLHCIEGGNHAWFGSYGEQAKDGTALITHEEQWEETVKQVKQLVERQ